MSLAHAASTGKLSSSQSICLDRSAQALSARRGFQVGTVAAICWFVFGLESIIRPNPLDLRDSLFHIPWILTIVTFWFVHRVQSASAVQSERGTFLALIVSMIAVSMGSIGIATRTPSLQVLAFPWGVLVWMIAMVLYGIATWRTHLLPHSSAVAFLLLEPGSILLGIALNPIVPIHDHGGYSGAVAKGMALWAIARGLRDIAQRA
jgi:hypothetical protein